MLYEKWFHFAGRQEDIKSKTSEGLIFHGCYQTPNATHTEVCFCDSKECNHSSKSSSATHFLVICGVMLAAIVKHLM